MPPGTDRRAARRTDPRSGGRSEGPGALVAPAPRPVGRRRRLVVSVVVLALLWGGLTGWRLDSWAMGVPAVLLGAALGQLMPAGPRWRLSLRGALVFAVWFTVQSVRGAVDVSRRAFSPQMPLRPGFRRYPLSLPPGPARVTFVNVITLLPGTLSAEIEAEAVPPMVVVHMLDNRADLQGDLGVLEDRVRALFALPPRPVSAAAAALSAAALSAADPAADPAPPPSAEPERP